MIQVALFPMLTASTAAACFPFASAFSAESAVGQIEGSSSSPSASVFEMREPGMWHGVCWYGWYGWHG